MNRRLKTAKAGLTLESRYKRGLLCLRGTFPAKPGSKRTKAHQQRLSLKHPESGQPILANPAGIKMAYAMAMQVASELAMGVFKWPGESALTVGKATCREWIQEFEIEWWKDRERKNLQKQATWENEFRTVFCKLPQFSVLTEDVLIRTIRNYSKPNTRSRQRYCDSYRRLAELAGLPADKIIALRGKYSSRSVAEQNIPSDDVLIEWWDKMPTQPWKLAYGIALCYGLRPSEIFRCDLSAWVDGAEAITVCQNTKTGAREAWPIAPKEWLNKLRSLGSSLPGIELERRNDLLAGTFSKKLKRMKCPFPPKAMRHAYAIRGIGKVPDQYAAKSMGHSVELHQEVYQKWINSRDMSDVFTNIRF